jgi:hypothetical protein
MSKKQRMINLKVKEVTLCNKGMNNKEYLLRKNKGGSKMNEELLKAVKKAKFDNEDAVIELLEKCDDKAGEALLSTMIVLKAANLGDDGLGVLLKASGQEISLSEEKIGQLVAKSLQEREEAETAEKEAIRKAKAGEIDLSEINNPATKAVLEVLVKAQKESVGVVKSLTERAEKAEDKIKKSEEAEILKKAVEKTSSFNGLSISPQKTGALLAKMSDEDGEELLAILKAANTCAQTAGLFKEDGSSRPGVSGGTYEKVQKMAQDQVSKSSNGETLESAMADIWEKNPELYTAYKAECSAN